MKQMYKLPSDTNIKDVIAAVYDCSRPQGLGFLHYTPDPLSDEELDKLASNTELKNLSLDYVAGRACKFCLREIKGEYYFDKDWFDHTELDSQTLANRLNAELVEINNV